MNTSKVVAIILGIVAAAGIATTIIFAIQNKKHKKMLAEANAALKALGAPEVKKAAGSEGAAVAQGTMTGTMTSGSPAGTNAASTPAA